MDISRNAFGLRAWRVKILALWLAVVVLALGAQAYMQRSSLLDELQWESATLYRAVSQRAGQHDAHLTTLSAIALAGGGERADLFLDVAATISRFYPRIKDVLLVPLDPALEPIATTHYDSETLSTLRAAARRSTGAPVLLAHPTRDGLYLMVKRSPNADAAIYAVILAIDASELIVSDRDFWTQDSARRRLTMSDDTLLTGTPASGALQFVQPLDSASQPLRLETGLDIRLLDILPPLRTAGIILLASLAYVAVLAVIRQRALAHDAAAQAALRGVEVQLSHAARINAMGEMASGMAHELTQPLTAILAQAQAGKRLLARDDLSSVGACLEETAAQAKRASSILERLRNWSKPHAKPLSPIDLRQAVGNVQSLLASDAARLDIALEVDVPPHAVPVLADQIEMEQVIHNLVRNAFDALAGQAGARVRVGAKIVTDRVVVEIADNGPGIPAELRPKIFTPFITTREDGMGLGLALSERLVERANGEIRLLDGKPGATFRIELPLAVEVRTAAQ